MKPPPPPPVWINGAPRSMRSTIAVVEGLATRSAPVSAPTSLDGNGFTIGFATGYTAGILTAAAVIASGLVIVGW